MTALENLKKEKEALLESADSGFIFMLLGVAFVLIFTAFAEKIPTLNMTLEIIKGILMLFICPITSLFLSIYIIGQIHPYPRIKEIDNELKKLES